MEYIERIAMGEQASYSGLESAIHLARYSLAKTLCVGRNVLDVACGEGYGAYLMAAKWGASSVLGVDVSADAVDSARAHFQAANLEFIQADVADLERVLEGRTFDLAVSLETIEHIPEPEQFLHALRNLLAPNGAIIISCPNDYLYYPDESQRNPFHLRKYTLPEFIELCSGVLGPPRESAMGIAVTGFANLRTVDEAAEIGVGMSARAITEAVAGVEGLILPAEKHVGPSSSASYFVAAWGGEDRDHLLAPASSVYPVGIDVLEARQKAFDEYVHWSSAELDARQVRLDHLSAELDARQVRQDHLSAELELCRDERHEIEALARARSAELELCRDQRDEIETLARARSAELEVAKGNLMRLRDERDRLQAAHDAVAYNPTQKQAAKAVFMSLGVRRSRLRRVLRRRRKGGSETRD